MKTLFLLRHAKSSWDDPTLADFERPLSERGKKAAPFMGAFLKKEGLAPEVVISSPAERARHTAELFIAAGQFDAQLKFDERVYEASPVMLAEVLYDIPDAMKNVMVVGHNPGMEGLIRHLAERGEPMPTAAVAVIDLPAARWRDLEAGSGHVRHIWRPKELAGK